MTFPSAERRSSIRWIFTASGSVLRRCCSSWSVVVVGTRRPFLFPTVKRPTIRVPAIVAWQMGITSWSSDSKTLEKVVSLRFASLSAALLWNGWAGLGLGMAGIASLQHSISHPTLSHPITGRVLGSMQTSAIQSANSAQPRPSSPQSVQYQHKRTCKSSPKHRQQR